VDDRVATGGSRCEPIMIDDVVPSVDGPLVDADRVPGFRKLIMNWPADKPSPP
jgi:hypothetical protein